MNDTTDSEQWDIVVQNDNEVDSMSSEIECGIATAVEVPHDTLDNNGEKTAPIDGETNSCNNICCYCCSASMCFLFLGVLVFICLLLTKNPNSGKSNDDFGINPSTDDDGGLPATTAIHIDLYNDQPDYYSADALADLTQSGIVSTGCVDFPMFPLDTVYALTDSSVFTAEATHGSYFQLTMLSLNESSSNPYASASSTGGDVSVNITYVADNMVSFQLPVAILPGIWNIFWQLNADQIVNHTFAVNTRYGLHPAIAAPFVAIADKPVAYQLEFMVHHSLNASLLTENMTDAINTDVADVLAIPSVQSSIGFIHSLPNLTKALILSDLSATIAGTFRQYDVSLERSMSGSVGDNSRRLDSAEKRMCTVLLNTYPALLVAQLMSIVSTVGITAGVHAVAIVLSGGLLALPETMLLYAGALLYMKTEIHVLKRLLVSMFGVSVHCTFYMSDDNPSARLLSSPTPFPLQCGSNTQLPLPTIAEQPLSFSMNSYTAANHEYALSALNHAWVKFTSVISKLPSGIAEIVTDSDAYAQLSVLFADPVATDAALTAKNMLYITSTGSLAGVCSSVGSLAVICDCESVVFTNYLAGNDDFQGDVVPITLTATYKQDPEFSATYTTYISATLPLSLFPTADPTPSPTSLPDNCFTMTGTEFSGIENGVSTYYVPYLKCPDCAAGPYCCTSGEGCTTEFVGLTADGPPLGTYGCYTNHQCMGNSCCYGGYSTWGCSCHLD